MPGGSRTGVLIVAAIAFVVPLGLGLFPSVKLLVGFAVLAQLLGLEVILGAFIAGAVLRLLDRDGAMTHPLFRGKLEAVGFGVFSRSSS